MTNGSSALYNTIKAQEASFAIPSATVAVNVGTFDAATGKFTYAAGWNTDETEGADVGSVDKPTLKKIAVWRVMSVDAVNVTLRFEVSNSQGNFVVNIPGLGRFETTQTTQCAGYLEYPFAKKTLWA